MSLVLVTFMSRNYRTPCFLSCCCCHGNRISAHGQNRGLPSNTSSRSATPCRSLHSGRQSTKLALGRYLFRVYQLPFYTGRMAKSSSDETGSVKGKKMTKVKEMYDSASNSVLSVTSDLQRKALGLRDQINMPTIKLPDVKLNDIKDAVRVSRLVNRKSAEYSKPHSEESSQNAAKDVTKDDMMTVHYSAAATVEEFIKASKEMEGEKQLVKVDEASVKTLERSTRKPQDSMSRAKKDFISKTSVNVRTRQLVRATRQAGSGMARLLRVEELTKHLISFPEARVVAVKENAIPVLLRYRDNQYQPLVEEVRETLSLLGYEDPVEGRGVRILSIDGGGTRGVVAVETLRQLEEMSGKSIYQMFDYISGVSSGAILAILLGVYKVSLDECEELYRRFSEEIFKRSTYVGVGKLFLSHAFYDTAAWEKMLKAEVGDRLMIETVRDPACPKQQASSPTAPQTSQYGTENSMGGELPGMLLSLLIILKVLSSTEAYRSCLLTGPSSSRHASCISRRLSSVPQDLPANILIDISPEDLICEEPTIVKFEGAHNNTVLEGEMLHLVCEVSGIPTPDITVILPSGLTATGLTLYLVCEASGIPTTDITVILPSGLIATFESDGRLTVKFNGTMTITNVTAADSGQYISIAASFVESDSTSAILQLVVIIQLKVTTTGTVAPVTLPLTTAGTLNRMESSSSYHESTPGSRGTFSIPVLPAPSKQPQPAPNFSLPVLIGSVCGSVVSTVLVVIIILTIWHKRKTHNPHSPSTPPVVYRNASPKVTISGHDQTGQGGDQTISKILKNAKSSEQAEVEYADIVLSPSNTETNVERLTQQPAEYQSLGPNRNRAPSDELPPLPPPSNRNNAGPTGAHDTLRYYQSLKKKT
ncbi:Calcium-independent phospholipase A2-gamma [Branchiostoma belcheri]|nr:Calcium-independent phospholipase A2-gamma [Branchiostoma belcheri]